MRRSTLATALLAILVAAAAAAEPAAAGERKIEIYRPQTRPAAELLGVAQSAIGPEGTASVDRGSNALLLVGPEAALADALTTLRALDRPRASVILHYESRRLDELDARGIRVDWSLGSDSVRVGNLRLPKGESGVRVGARVIQSERQGGLSGLLRVLDGEVGRIHTGRTVPVRSYGFYGSELAFVSAESGFEALPRVLGDGRVQVQLQPVEAAVDAGGRVRFTEAATTVTLRPGETVALGGIARTSEQHGRGARVLSASREAHAERVLLLSVEVETPPSAPAAGTPP